MDGIVFSSASLSVWLGFWVSANLGVGIELGFVEGTSLKFVMLLFFLLCGCGKNLELYLCCARYTIEFKKKHVYVIASFLSGACIFGGSSPSTTFVLITFSLDIPRQPSCLPDQTLLHVSV